MLIALFLDSLFLTLLILHQSIFDDLDACHQKNPKQHNLVPKQSYFLHSNILLSLP